MTAQRQILQEKTKAVEEIGTLIQNHKVIALANLWKVRAAQLQLLRKKLKTEANIRVVKNTLIRRAIAQVKNRPNLEKLEEHLAGSMIFLFTDLNPFHSSLGVCVDTSFTGEILCYGRTTNNYLNLVS